MALVVQLEDHIGPGEYQGLWRLASLCDFEVELHHHFLENGYIFDDNSFVLFVVIVVEVCYCWFSFEYKQLVLLLFVHY